MNNEDIYIDGKGSDGGCGGGCGGGGCGGCGGGGDYENTILITLKDTNNLVKILYDKIILLENENSKFKKQMYYLNKNLTELKDNNFNLNNKIEQDVNLTNNIEQYGTINKCNNDTDLNDFIINSVNEYNFETNIDNNESVINESDIINEINFIVKADNGDKDDKAYKGDKGDKVDKGDKGDKGDNNKDYIKNKLKKLIIETQQNAINVNKKKKNMLFTMR
jgi:hypothetical protein